MKKSELFHKSVNILVDAYFNDMLVACDCRACAVGNLVAGLNDKKIFKVSELGLIYFNIQDDFKNNLWFHAISDGIVRYDKLNPEIREQINSTGYTAEQLAKIEDVFMNAYSKECDEVELDYFNPLMAVVDCLIEIHEGTEEEKLVAKKQFERV